MSLTYPSPIQTATIDRPVPIAVPTDADPSPARFQRVVAPSCNLSATAETEHQLDLHMRGELDLGIGYEVRCALERELARGKDLTLDLSGVTFLDSAGLTALLDAINAGRNDGRTVTLTGPLAPQVQRVLQLTDNTHLISAA